MWYFITVAWDILQRTAKKKIGPTSDISGENERLSVGRRKREKIDYRS